MKNIDKIIKYLSGELSPGESELFMKEVTESPELKGELDSVSAIWKEISKQLKLQDGPESSDREQLIAEILAEHDVRNYGKKKATKKEIAFKANLQQTMREAQKVEKPKRSISRRAYSLITLVAAAASIALVFILNPPSDLNELTDSYYHPASEPVFETINSASRSGMSSAMALFEQGSYKESIAIAKTEMEKYPEIIEIQLLYSLACFESGDLVLAESELLEITLLQQSNFYEIANWYLALIYLKSDMNQEATDLLLEIVKEKGKYSKGAKMLLRKMD